MKLRATSIVLLLTGLLVACGGGGGGGSSIPTGGGGGGPTPTPTPVPSTQSANTILGASGTVTFAPIASGASGTLTFPAAAAGSANAVLTLQSSLPSGAPIPSDALRHKLNLGGPVTAIAYITLTPSGTLSYNATPSFAMTFPAGTLAGSVYVAFFDPTNAAAGWNVLLGPITGSGTLASFASSTISKPITLAATQTYIYALVETGTPLPTPSPTPTATPSPTPAPTPTSTPTASSTTGPGLALTGPPTYGNGWGPPAVANAFNFPVQSGWNGTGIAVAILMDGSFNQSDLNAYLSYFQIPMTSRTISVVPIDGGPPPPTRASQFEMTLDIETVAGLAPGANIIAYEIPDLSGQSLLDGFNRAVSDNNSSVINFSAGGCEDSSYKTTVAPLVQAASSKGITLVASSGDQGSTCPSGSGFVPGVAYPASDPNAIGVGGTETAPNAPIANPAAWNDNACPAPSAATGATGGGVSQVFSIPTFQFAGASSTARNVPDIAFPACWDAVNEEGAWSPVGGTSWSAPQFSAMLAEIDQFCRINFQQGANFLYYAAGKAGYNDFIDVTSGNNSWQGYTPYFNATSGFDNVSGIGIPLGMNVANTVCPGRVAAAAIRVPQAIQATETPTVSVEPKAVIKRLPDLGEVPSTVQVRVAIVLQLAAANAENEQLVTSMLQTAGFTIEKRYSNHLLIDATASAQNVERFFSTSIRQYAQNDHGTRYANATPLAIPTALQSVISGVSADNLVTMRHAAASRATFAK